MTVLDFNFFDCDRAIAKGLTYRTADDTAAATLAWDSTLPADRDLRAGMKSEREEEVLKMWKERE